MIVCPKCKSKIILFADDIKRQRNNEILSLWVQKKKQNYSNKNIIMIIRKLYNITERQIYNILKKLK